MVEPAGNVASIVSAVLPVGKRIGDPIGRQIKYAFKYKSNLEKLEKEVWKLKDAREDLKGNVDAAEKNLEKIKHSVKVWQEEANSIIDEAENLIEQKNNSSSNPDFITRFKHSKKASKLTEDKIPQLLQDKREIGNVSYPAIILEDRLLAADKNYDPFQSRESTLKEIVNALNDNNLYMLGINAMPGVGKTTLAKEVGRQVKEEKLFDEVVFVEVTQTVDEKRIQKELGDKLGLRFNNETEMRNKLYARLTSSKEKSEEEKEKEKKKRKEEKEKKEEEKILIILDNVWEEIDLKSIGIPEGGVNGKCKLLLTIRKRDVLVRMGSKALEIGVLSEEESWRLFKNTIGDCVETSDQLKSLVKDICKKCGCLPIAIVTTAKALKNKRDLHEFKDALRQLNRSSSTNLIGPLKVAYLSIEMSYNYLSGEELKKTFLLCSLMRHQCSILDLVKYVLGLDTFEAIYTIEEARNKVHTLINDLKDSGLLINDQTNESFSMHDFVREVALSIANRDNQVFSMRNEIEGEWPSHDRLKNCKNIFIRDSTISELHKGLECLELESIFMNTKVGDSCVEIPEDFFKGMTKLKVLELTRMRFSSLQSSLHLLEYLQTLCLDYSNFEDVVIIGKLEKLKVLSLRGSNVKQLPREIGQLSQLRLLDLRDCRELKVIAPNVISKLFRLEELYMGGCAVQWETRRLLYVKRSKASLDELNHLPNLTTLELYIEDDNVFPKFLSSKKLKRYNICIGNEDLSDCFLCKFGELDYKKWFYEHETLRMLKLIRHNSIIRSMELECFTNVEFLCLGKLKGVRNVLYELDKEGFPQLKHLHVCNNPNLTCIVDSTKSIAHDAFPNLEMLYLFNLSKLQNIFRGHSTTNSFGNLKIILVESCNKLENIFSFSYARILPKLERLSVDDCKNLKEIFSNEREDNNKNNEVIEYCYQLHHLTLKSLPQLTSIYIEGKKSSTLQKRQKDKLDETLTPLFDIKVVFPNLEALELRNINFEKIWDCQCSTLMSPAYKNLTHLNVWGCNKLKYVFPSCIVKSCEQLQCLEIIKCISLKAIVQKSEKEGESAKFIFLRVTFLSLKWLPELESFYPGEHTSEWPMLKELVVCYCDKVKISNSKNNEGQLDISAQKPFFLFEKINPNLDTLKLSGMECKMIWQGQFPHDHFCSLKTLRVEHDDESTSIPLGISQRLKFLEAEKHIETTSSMKTSLSDLQNLEVLQVYGYNLINLAQFSISFQNLTGLKVKRCNRLINLVTSSTAKSLEQLRELKISACKMMIEVVETEGDGTVKDGMIVFKNLKFLSLKHLESLERFGNYKFNFPSLIELKVNNCRKMKIFCEGKITTPNLRNIKKSKLNERYWKDDLNITIQQLHKESKGKERRHRWRLIMWITLVVIYLNLSWRIICVLLGTVTIGFVLTGISRQSVGILVGAGPLCCEAYALGFIYKEYQGPEFTLRMALFTYIFLCLYLICRNWNHAPSWSKRFVKKLKFICFDDLVDYSSSLEDRFMDYEINRSILRMLAELDVLSWQHVMVVLLCIVLIFTNFDPDKYFRSML